MKNIAGIAAALILSAAIAGSVFAGVKTQDGNQTDSAAAASSTKTAMHKKIKTKKHRKTKRAKSSKTTAPSTKK